MGNLCQCPESHEFLGGEVDLSDECNNKSKRGLLTTDEQFEENSSLVKANNNFFYNTNSNSLKYSRMKQSKRKILLNDSKYEIQKNNQFHLNIHKSLEITNNSIINESRDYDFRLLCDRVFSYFNEIRMNQYSYMLKLEEYVNILKEKLKEGDYIKTESNANILKDDEDKEEKRTNVKNNVNPLLQSTSSNLNIHNNIELQKHTYSSLLNQLDKLESLYDIVKAFSQNIKTKPTPILWSEKLYSILQESLSTELFLSKGKISNTQLSAIKEKIEEHLNLNYVVNIYFTEGRFSFDNIITNILLENKDAAVELLYEKQSQGVVVVLNNEHHNTSCNFLILIKQVFKRKSKNNSKSKLMNSILLSRTNSCKSNSKLEFSVNNSNNCSKISPVIKKLSGNSRVNINNKSIGLSTNVNTEITNNNLKNKRDESSKNNNHSNLDELLMYGKHSSKLNNANTNIIKDDDSDDISDYEQKEVNYDLNDDLFKNLDYYDNIKEGKFYEYSKILTAEFILNNGDIQKEIFKISS